MEDVIVRLQLMRLGQMTSAASAPYLPTSSISVVSHTHGRERREERGIERRELQEAVKHGRQERANPGRDGRPRLRFTHKGIVYITDPTGRHEITSWRMQDALDEPPPLPLGGGGGGTWHVVVIVDHSGSMRKNDVPGYQTRTAAVYDCLARDLVEPQLRVGGGRMEVSLIEMSDGATVVLERSPVDRHLLEFLKRRAQSYARSHGNYLPALDAALELLAGDAARQTQLFLLFLSDGAPSDHGQTKLQAWPGAAGSRLPKWQQVQELCVQRIKRMGDLLGRDRVFIGTVAFGPPSEEYAVMAAMAAALPRNSFQKLGLSAACLRTAFTSLTSSLTTMRTDVGGRRGLTLRPDIGIKGQRQAYEESHRIMDNVGWDVYCGFRFLNKQRYDLRTGTMVAEPFTGSTLADSWGRAYPGMVQRGVAHAQRMFGEGAERVVYQCSEVVSVDGGLSAHCVGPRLVAKSTRFSQHLDDADFHRVFCRTQGESEELAQLFNRRLQLGPEWQVHFLPCFVYTIRDYNYSARGVMDLLVEQELEGRFTKWNNNAGGVTRVARGGREARPGGMGAIVEEDEEGDEDEADSSTRVAVVEHVPQCFSHFTYCVTEGKKLVCDLQGVWNAVDGFTMTDPVIHHRAGYKRNGATDKGPAGIAAFFSTHVCNALCRRLGLPTYPPAAAAVAQQPVFVRMAPPALSRSDWWLVHSDAGLYSAASYVWRS